MARKLEPRDAWMALAATTLNYILMCIPDGSFGILYGPLTSIFDASRTSIAWAMSLYWVFIYLAGLVFSPIIDMYGCRPLAFVGAVLYGTGASLSCVAPNLPVLCLTYGVLSGLGCGALYLSCSTIIQQKFTYNRGFANGVSSLGFSVGGIIHPLHTLYLMETFDVRGTFLIHGALAFHALIFSFALRSPHKLKAINKQTSIVKHSKGSQKDIELDEIDNCQSIKSSGQNSGSVVTDVPCGEYEVKGLSMQGEMGEDCGRQTEEADTLLSVAPSDETVIDKAVTINKSVGNLQPDHGNYAVHSNTSEMIPTTCDNLSQNTSIHSAKDHQVKKNNCFKHIDVKKYFLGMLDFSLVKNPVFMFSTLHFFMLWMARLSIMAQIVSCAIHRDIDKDLAAYLISISGFGNLFMRLICAVLMNFSWMDPILFSGLAAAFVVVSGFMAAFSTTYTMFSVTMVLMGMSEAIAMANLPQLVVHIIGVARFPRGIALLWTLMLPAPFGAAPLSGWLVDVTGQYMTAFVVIGAEGVASTILAVVVFLLYKRQRTKAKQDNTGTYNKEVNVI